MSATPAPPDSQAARVAALTPERRRLLALMLRQGAAPPEGQPRLAAFVTAEGAGAEELRRFAQERLPHFMVPASVELLPALPRTPNGKVDRDALLRRARARRADAPAAAAPAGDAVEARLRALWAELLGVARVGPDDDFFALGGHSLLAVRMLARVKEELGHDLPVAAIVEAPTVARLAAQIRAAASADGPTPQIVPLQPAGALPPLFLLPLHVHGPLHYRHLKAQMGLARPLLGFASFALEAPGAEPLSVEGLARGYVEALLRERPAGPYYLAGVSVAGLLAYEMARQLRARGVTDVTPILFDTWGPGYPERLPPRLALAGLAGRLRALAAHGVAPLALAGDLLAEAARRPYTAAQAALARARARRAGPAADPHLSPHGIDAALAALIAGYLAAPRPYAGGMLLFHASLQPWAARHDPALGWGRWVAGPIAVEYLRGDHLGILRRARAGRLAARLERRLAQLDLQFGHGPQQR
jgi:thioesterase domain-containing protein/acyl carrier protein